MSSAQNIDIMSGSNTSGANPKYIFSNRSQFCRGVLS